MGFLNVFCRRAYLFNIILKGLFLAVVLGLTFIKVGRKFKVKNQLVLIVKINRK